MRFENEPQRETRASISPQGCGDGASLQTTPLSGNVSSLERKRNEGLCFVQTVFRLPTNWSTHLKLNGRQTTQHTSNCFFCKHFTLQISDSRNKCQSVSFLCTTEFFLFSYKTTECWGNCAQGCLTPQSHFEETLSIVQATAMMEQQQKRSSLCALQQSALQHVPTFSETLL